MDRLVLQKIRRHRHYRQQIRGTALFSLWIEDYHYSPLVIRHSLFVDKTTTGRVALHQQLPRRVHYMRKPLRTQVRPTIPTCHQHQNSLLLTHF